MTSTEERMQILKMIQEGKITADEGAKLLEALNAAKPEKRPPTPPTPPGAPGSDARWLRVRVTDLRNGKSKVNVNIPMGLVNVGVKMGARFAPNMEGVNLEEMMRAIKSGASGKIMDVSDEESGEHVEIYVE
ncbi:hypothetical protein TFLX_02861 [Thermoflexales bacterium]|nr:hypothetical protein TFLX_02861 [Thermoflexales bacterium]